MDQKLNKKATIQQTLDTFLEDGHADYLRKDIEYERQRLETYY